VNVDREALSLHRAELAAVVLSRFGVMTERIEHRASSIEHRASSIEAASAASPSEESHRSLTIPTISVCAPPLAAMTGTSAATTIHHH
jgi:hypothetical protein